MGAKGGVWQATLGVPSTVTARIQEAHILIGHWLCERIEAGLTGG